MKPLKSKELKERKQSNSQSCIWFQHDTLSENTSAQAIFDRAARSRESLPNKKSLESNSLNISSQSVPSNISELDRDWKREKEDSRGTIAEDNRSKNVKNVENRCALT